VLVPTGAGIAYYRNTFSPRLRSALRLIYVDLRGTGGSTGALDGATFASLGDDLDAVREALGLAPVFVMGHSNHGCIALEYGLRHPEHCAGVISVASGPDFTRTFAVGDARFQVEATAKQRETIERRLAALALADGTAMDGDEAAIRQYAAISPLGWRDPDFDPFPLWGGQFRGAARYLDWMRAYGATWDFTEKLADVSVPVLVIAGRHDYLCPVELWTPPVDSLPNGTFVTFEGSAHNPQYEEPERFDDEVLSFIRANGADPRDSGRP
jgi:proline iminopeptidase